LLGLQGQLASRGRLGGSQSRGLTSFRGPLGRLSLGGAGLASDADRVAGGSASGGAGVHPVTVFGAISPHSAPAHSARRVR